MGIFDFLSEIKIKEWLKKKEDPEYIPPPPVEKTELGKPVESYLLDEIITLIKRAGNQNGEARKQTVSEAGTLEIQLMASLEQGGYRLMAKHMEQTIIKAKSDHLWKT